ncbi:MAG TPA: hypothetical protein VKU84_16930 [Stellaceae bacterium]|nr:hypothetical protein [Stellaceae bacterium]
MTGETLLDSAGLTEHRLAIDPMLPCAGEIGEVRTDGEGIPWYLAKRLGSGVAVWEGRVAGKFARIYRPPFERQAPYPKHWTPTSLEVALSAEDCWAIRLAVEPVDELARWYGVPAKVVRRIKRSPIDRKVLAAPMPDDVTEEEITAWFMRELEALSKRYFGRLALVQLRTAAMREALGIPTLKLSREATELLARGSGAGTPAKQWLWRRQKALSGGGPGLAKRRRGTTRAARRAQANPEPQEAAGPQSAS